MEHAMVCLVMKISADKTQTLGWVLSSEHSSIFYTPS